MHKLVKVKYSYTFEESSVLSVGRMDVFIFKKKFRCYLPNANLLNFNNDFLVHLLVRDIEK